MLGEIFQRFVEKSPIAVVVRGVHLSADESSAPGRPRQGHRSTLGYPQAALFGFCVALVACNARAVVLAALRAVHGAQIIDHEVSGYYIANEIAETHRGMMIAIPELFLFTSAPLSSRARTISSYPAPAAIIKTVSPQVFLIFTSAPLCRAGFLLPYCVHPLRRSSKPFRQGCYLGTRISH